MESEINEKMEIADDILRKLFEIMEQSDASIFDTFCAFDVNRKGYLEKFDFLTGLQSLGVAVEAQTMVESMDGALQGQNELDIIWQQMTCGATKLTFPQFVEYLVSHIVFSKQQKKDDIKLSGQPAVHDLGQINSIIVSYFQSGHMQSDLTEKAKTKARRRKTKEAEDPNHVTVNLVGCKEYIEHYAE